MTAAGHSCDAGQCTAPHAVPMHVNAGGVVVSPSLKRKLALDRSAGAASRSDGSASTAFANACTWAPVLATDEMPHSSSTADAFIVYFSARSRASRSR